MVGFEVNAARNYLGKTQTEHFSLKTRTLNFRYRCPCCFIIDHSFQTCLLWSPRPEFTVFSKPTLAGLWKQELLNLRGVLKAPEHHGTKSLPVEGLDRPSSSVCSVRQGYNPHAFSSFERCCLDVTSLSLTPSSPARLLLSLSCNMWWGVPNTKQHARKPIEAHMHVKELNHRSLNAGRDWIPPL